MVILFTFFFDEDTITARGSVYEYPHMLLIYGYLAMFLISLVFELIANSIYIKSVIIDSFIQSSDNKKIKEKSLSLILSNSSLKKKKDEI